MNRADKAAIGNDMVDEVTHAGQPPQDALAEALTCLRWYAKEAGLSFSLAVDESWIGMTHDRVNGKESR